MLAQQLAPAAQGSRVRLSPYPVGSEANSRQCQIGLNCRTRSWCGGFAWCYRGNPQHAHIGNWEQKPFTDPITKHYGCFLKNVSFQLVC